MTLNGSEIYYITWLQRRRKRSADAAENLGFDALKSKNFGLGSLRGPDLYSARSPVREPEAMPSTS
jgi:hypothetical protein